MLLRGSVGPQVNKFEKQVSSDHHQMSLAGEGGVAEEEEGWGWSSGLMSGGRGVTLPCDISHDAFDVTSPLPMDRMADGQMPVKTLPSRNFVCGW